MPRRAPPWTRDRPERWPSGRRRTPAKGVRVKSPSRVRIPLSPPVISLCKTMSYAVPAVGYCQPTASFGGLRGIDPRLVARRLDRNGHARLHAARRIPADRELSPKRPGRHPRFGSIYFWCLTAVFVTVSALAAVRWSEDYHLFILGTLAFAAAYLGRRAASGGTVGSSLMSQVWAPPMCCS